MTRQINAGGVRIGGGAPVSIQSMLNTATTDVEGSRCPDRRGSRRPGVSSARLAVPDQAAAKGCCRYRGPVSAAAGGGYPL